MEDRKLTVKQRKFADNYIKSGNATQSAIKAGYSKKTANVIGSENLAKPYIASYIDNKLDEISNTKIASAEEVLEYLTRVMRGEEKEQEAIYNTRSGQVELVEKEAAMREKTKAAELMGKKHTLFVDRKEIDVSIDRSLEDFFGDE